MKTSTDILIQSFQLTFSLRSLSLQGALLLLLLKRTNLQKHAWKDIIHIEFDAGYGVYCLTGLLQPSRRMSLSTLAASNGHFLIKSLQISSSYQAALRNEIIDPFHRLVEDRKLQALDQKLVEGDTVKVHGSKEDNEDALMSLLTINITDEQSPEFFASMILKAMGNISDADSSNVN